MKRIPSEEANSSSASQEIPAFYETPRFITAFATAHYLFLSWASSTQSVPAQSTSWHILVQNPFYGYVFQVDSFIQVAPPKPCLPYTCYLPFSYSSFLRGLEL